ncbi:endonuclease/exonuclease/phosphatase family protein [Caballeronia mineralivorans]|jgi:hypothetical protein|uniref:endonuclease/exonuclease/phosphatase family protein n=1 Tax=Caballeronia mineralivorans TaxID=2010198 RepID=UPI0023F41694|nr:hypothetical protein [Caballeronia mineralivorans]MDB5787249.1 endonuclease [Caballeronia mineralivorans]MEA3103180.1 hypothetical protein [Caballeronia mineralivorans]
MTSMHEVRMEDMRGAKSTLSRGIRIATYNVHGAVGLDGKLAPERIAAMLAEIDGLFPRVSTCIEVCLHGWHRITIR